MSRNCRSLLALLFVCMVVSLARAQERGLGGAPAENDTPPPGVEKLYWDLTKTKDRAIKSAAERYVKMVRLQEWSDASGKFKTVARYVKHDPNLTTVTIEIVRGRGAEQTKEQKTVPVDKLSATCQSRVRQIDASQKNLKAWAAAHPDEVGGATALGAGPTPQDLGGPMQDEVGATPAPAPTEIGLEGEAPLAAAPTAEPDPSESDPDPLGFAELPPAPAVPPGGEAPPDS
jgi:hypothetical protein